MSKPLLNASEWDSLDQSRLPAILEAMLEAHPEPEKLRGAKPGIYLREAESDRLEAYVIDQNGLPYIIGYFPRTILLRHDIGHPAANN